MGLDQPDQIDALCLDRGGHTILVVLIALLDDLEELAALAQIQRKLNRYFDFIESGEVYQQMSEAAHRSLPATTPVKIEIRANRELGRAEGPNFLRQVRAACREAGIAFEYIVAPCSP